MAKFVKQTSDLAVALNRLQGFADNLISSETNRRIQLGREKEARMTDAYQYMLNNENAEIAELETALAISSASTKLGSPYRPGSARANASS